MRKVIFLTQADQPPFEGDDVFAIAPLRQRGIETLRIPWQKAVGQLGDADLVVIRSTYDYIHQPGLFFETLTHIEQSKPLANPARVVRWNMDKTYLLKMAAAGLAVIPTLAGETLDQVKISDYFDAFSTDKLVVKPTIGASSDGIFVLEKAITPNELQVQSACLKGRPFLVQPFLENVLREGEYSLFFFNKSFSHGVLKQPSAGEFRVQQEFGGSTLRVEPPQAAITLAEKALALVEDPLLYARVDMVRWGEGFALMELELIEPQLFLKSDPQAPERFADAILECLEQRLFV